MLTQIHHKKNELFEIEFYQDKECTEAFDFTNARYLYIDGLNGDVTPIFKLHILGSFNIFTPYIPQSLLNECKHGLVNTYVKTLNDITPNLSKYILEDNAVLFLSEKDRELYDCYPVGTSRVYNEKFELPIESSGCGDPDCSCEYPYTKITIFLPHGTKSEIQKANEVAKELKEKYGVEEVNVFALHCFQYINEPIFLFFPPFLNEEDCYINTIITTNSTGILPVQDNERLQVIDCKEIFEEYLKENN